MQYTVAKLAETFNLTISGDRNIVIEGVCGISDNKTKNLSFLSDKRKTRMAEESDIPVYIVSMETKLNGKTLLHHQSPEYIFCLISELFSFLNDCVKSRKVASFTWAAYWVISLTFG